MQINNICIKCQTGGHLCNIWMLLLQSPKSYLILSILLLVSELSSKYHWYFSILLFIFKFLYQYLIFPTNLKCLLYHSLNFHIYIWVHFQTPFILTFPSLTLFPCSLILLISISAWSLNNLFLTLFHPYYFFNYWEWQNTLFFQLTTKEALFFKPLFKPLIGSNQFS